MKNRIARLVAASAFISCSLSVSGFAQSVTQINQCGTTISQPGHYVVPNSLVCSYIAAPAITIDSNNVQLAVNGTLEGAETSIAINANKIHLTVNGSVSGRSPSIGITGNGSNILIDGSGAVSGTIGINLTGNKITLRGITVSSYVAGPGGPAVTLNGINERILNTTIRGTNGALKIGNNSRIIGNFLSIWPYAFVIDAAIAAGDNNVIQNNHGPSSLESSSNSLFGGRIIVGSHNIVRKNNNFSAIEIDGENNVVNQNETVGYDSFGLYGIAADGVGNVIIGNTSGSAYDPNGPPCMNVWRRNQFQSTSGAVACIH